MHKLFKPLSKRDAKIAAVLFGAGFLYMLYTIVKDMLSGRPFEELHSEVILLAFIGLIEWGMITVGFSKDKEKENAGDEAGPENEEAVKEPVSEDLDDEE